MRNITHTQKQILTKKLIWHIPPEVHAWWLKCTKFYIQWHLILNPPKVDYLAIPHILCAKIYGISVDRWLVKSVEERQLAAEYKFIIIPIRLLLCNRVEPLIKDTSHMRPPLKWRHLSNEATSNTSQMKKPPKPLKWGHLSNEDTPL